MGGGVSGPVLEFLDVDLPGSSARPALAGIELSLTAGQLVLLECGRGPAAFPLADAALGLTRAARGVVRFEGVDWRERSAVQAAASRHAIGRVYAGTEWVSNLNVDENVILGCCHHTSRPEAQVVDEALALAARFGLDGLSSRRPELVPHDELRACALVRAFLGSPRLLVLERPLRGVNGLRAPLLEALREARRSGAAVLWLTGDRTLFESDETGADLRYVLEGRALRAVGGDRS